MKLSKLSEHSPIEKPKKHTAGNNRLCDREGCLTAERPDKDHRQTSLWHCHWVTEDNRGLKCLQRSGDT